MTNFDIQRHAAQFAEAWRRSKRHLDPDDAWYIWSERHGVRSPAARLLFEAEYEARLDGRSERH